MVAELDTGAALALLIPALTAALSALAVYAKSEASKNTRDRGDLNAMWRRVRALEITLVKAGMQLEELPAETEARRDNRGK